RRRRRKPRWSPSIRSCSSNTATRSTRRPDRVSFDALIEAAAAKHNVRAALIAAVIEHESAGDPNAIGDGGLARGLMQMHPDAAKDVGAVWNDLFDPAAAIDAGTRYLRALLNRFGEETWALAAYNQGPTRIGQAKAYADAILRMTDE